MIQAFLSGAEYDEHRSSLVMLIEKNIGEVIIPEGTSRVGEYAFCNCKAVTYIDIPDSVTSIENYAFYGVGSDSSGVIEGAGKNGEVIIPDSVTHLGYSVFVWSYIKGFVISKNISNIRQDTFSGCSKCESYDFTRHESVPTLMDVSAFKDMTKYNKAKIYVPTKLYPDWIGATNWSTYEDYIMPKISEGLIYGDAEVYDPMLEGYFVVGRGSFDGKELVIPEKYNGWRGEMPVVGMVFECFKNDDNISFLYLPESIYYIGGSLFNDCTSLKDIYMPGVTMISSFEFANLASLRYVKFSKNFYSLGGGVFYDCAGVEFDFSDCIQIPYFDSYGRGAEFGMDPVIRVPAALYDSWRNDTNWANYRDYIMAAE